MEKASFSRTIMDFNSYSNRHPQQGNKLTTEIQCIWEGEKTIFNRYAKTVPFSTSQITVAQFQKWHLPFPA